MELATIKKIGRYISSEAIIRQYHHIIDLLKVQLVKLRHLAETNYKLGLHHLHVHNMSDAELRFRIVLYLQPEHADAHYQLAKCLFVRGKKEAAKKYLEKAIKLRPAFPEAQYILCILTNKSTIQGIPPSIIAEFFDNAASTYDKDFNSKNGYKVPQEMVKILIPHLDKAHQYTVLDIGCGTGQCGLQFVHSSPTFELYGIDISKHMLKIASHVNYDNNLPIYKNLIHQNYHDFLGKTSQTYDIIMAGLSLHYQKELEPGLKLIAKSLNKHGYVVFAVEEVVDAAIDTCLNRDSENFCYNKDIVKQEVKKAGLRLLKLDHAVIKNNKLAIICVCTK